MPALGTRRGVTPRHATPTEPAGADRPAGATTSPAMRGEPAPPSRHRRRWTAREERILRASVGIVPAAELAERLGRTVTAIRAHAHALCLFWYRPAPGRPHPGYTLSDVARLLGVDPWTVRRWIRAGWLPAAQREVRLGRHPLWLIGADDLERFLRECRPVYAPARIRDPAWRAVAALPPERDPWLTPCEAARLAGCTAHHLRRLIAAGRLPARRWGGRYYLRRSALATLGPPDTVRHRGEAPRRGRTPAGPCRRDRGAGYGR